MYTQTLARIGLAVLTALTLLVLSYPTSTHLAQTQILQADDNDKPNTGG